MARSLAALSDELRPAPSRRGACLASHDRIDGGSRDRDADDDNVAVAQRVVDRLGEAARNPCWASRLRPASWPSPEVGRPLSSGACVRGRCGARASPSIVPRASMKARAARPVSTSAPTRAVTRAGGARVRLMVSISAGGSTGLKSTDRGPAREEARSPAPLLAIHTRRPGLRAGRVRLVARGRCAGAGDAPDLAAHGIREAVRRRCHRGDRQASGETPLSIALSLTAVRPVYAPPPPPLATSSA